MDTALTEKLSSIRELVAHRIGEQRYRTWFGESTSFVLSNDSLDVCVANPFVGQWIASNFMDDLIFATRSVFGEEGAIDVRIVPGDGNPRAAANGADPSPQRRPASVSTARSAPDRVRLRSSLDGFVIGPSNRIAYSAAQQLARAPGEAFKLLVLHGGCGLGKTHLLQGICNAVWAQHPTVEWRYISGEEFTNEFINAIRNGKLDVFRGRFRKVDLLVIDDIHFLANKKATQDEFLHTFNAIDAAGKTIVLSSDKHPRMLALCEPLINRLIAGMAVELRPPDFDTRLKILQKRAALLNRVIPNDVLEYVAVRVKRNVRELEGALLKLIAYSGLTGEEVTVKLASDAIDEHQPRERKLWTPVAISEIVGKRFGVTREQIDSTHRDRTVALARALAMFLVRKHTHLSFPEIGRAMGGKNHSTVLMATQRVERMLAGDESARWKSAAGPQEARVSELLQELEAELMPDDD